MFPHERKMQQLQQQRQLVEQLRREAAINRITVSQVENKHIMIKFIRLSSYFAGVQGSAKILYGSRKRGLPDKRICEPKTKSIQRKVKLCCFVK